VLALLLLPLVSLAWSQVRARAGAALLSTVPAYYVVIAGLGSFALSLGAWALRDRRALRARRSRQWTDEEQRLLAFVLQGGSGGVRSSAARTYLALDEARFDLLVTGMRGLILSEAWGAYRAAPEGYALKITRHGKEVLAGLLKRNPQLLDR
jgi:hypothetical protein